jgi:hypothetical protein
VPEADEQPPEGFFAPPSAHQDATNLAVPGAGASDHLQPGQPSVPAPRASSPFRPRGARALAVALNLGGQRGLSSEASAAAPREITLPQDTNVDGRPIESALYCDAMECPICFLTYPPYLNYTRCCSQPICSECFVQIKRPDPHLPEHHPGEDASPANVPDEEREEELISEPSTCPYCQQSELGVTYEPPPFRRGLVYSSPLGDGTLRASRCCRPALILYPLLAALLSPAASQAMSSQSSLNSPPNPASPTSPGTRRRTHSLSANAPNVVTTDRIRPDWETKLMTARQNRARRAAAATALHTAAFMTNQPTSWGRLAIFRHAVSPGSSSAARQPSTHAEEGGASSNDNNSDPAAQAFSRLEEFENFLVAEGIRQSLASKESEDRKEAKRREKEERKAREKTEKEERKAREQREKEERKTLKQQQKSVYGGGAGSAASRSSLSIPFGRKRGNSTASLTKGNSPAQSALPTPGEVDEEESQPQGHSQSVDKGKAPERPVSRLRHFSTASSMQSRQQESLPGSADGAESASPASQGHGGPAQSSAGARASALSLDSAADSDGAPAGAETTDPLFNYHSMAKGMGMDIDTGCIEDTPATVVSEAAQAQETRQEEGDVDVSVATLRPEGTLEVSQSDTQVDSQPQVQTKLEAPQLVVTPDTPADGPGETGDKFSMGPTSHIAESQEVAR